jgi:hypothetical protein
MCIPKVWQAKSNLIKIFVLAIPQKISSGKENKYLPYP